MNLFKNICLFTLMNNIVYVSSDPVSFYNEYHKNYVNKLIHAFCIPLIVLSIRIFTNNVIFYFRDSPYRFTRTFPFSLGRILSNLYAVYYFTYGWFPGLVMLFYFWFIEIAHYFIDKNIPRKYFLAWCMFCFGWTMQFIGHGIEGRKPALFDSISQAFTGAPIFSMQFFFPNLLE